MKKVITVKAITGAKENKVVKLDKDFYKIKISANAEKGKANQAIIKLLSDYFKTPKINITIKKGLTSSNKIIEILY